MPPEQHGEHQDRHQEQGRAGTDGGPVHAALADDRRNEWGRRLGAARGQEHREGIFVPGEDQAENRGGRNARRRLRQHHLPEGLEPRIAVDHRRFLIFARDLVDEALEQPHRQRHVHRRVEQDHAERGVRQAEMAVHEVDRIATAIGGIIRVDRMNEIVLERHPEAREP